MPLLNMYCYDVRPAKRVRFAIASSFGGRVSVALRLTAEMLLGALSVPKTVDLAVERSDGIGAAVKILPLRNRLNAWLSVGPYSV